MVFLLIIIGSSTRDSNPLSSQFTDDRMCVPTHTLHAFLRRLHRVSAVDPGQDPVI